MESPGSARWIFRSSGPTGAVMNLQEKHTVAAAVIAALRAELDGYLRAARAAQAAATDPDSKAENKYDTRTLEASYLARGQALRVAETEGALAEWETMPVLSWRPMDPVNTGAVVTVADAEGERSFFIGPAGGGTSVTPDGREFTVLTRDSPLGKQLLGRREGDVLHLDTAAGRRETEILAVW